MKTQDVVKALRGAAATIEKLWGNKVMDDSTQFQVIELLDTADKLESNYVVYQP